MKLWHQAACVTGQTDYRDAPASKNPKLIQSIFFPSFKRNIEEGFEKLWKAINSSSDENVSTLVNINNIALLKV